MFLCGRAREEGKKRARTKQQQRTKEENAAKHSAGMEDTLTHCINPYTPL